MNETAPKEPKEITTLEQALAEIEKLKNSVEYYRELFYKESRKKDSLTAIVKAFAEII